MTVENFLHTPSLLVLPSNTAWLIILHYHNFCHFKNLVIYCLKLRNFTSLTLILLKTINSLKLELINCWMKGYLYFQSWYSQFVVVNKHFGKKCLATYLLLTDIPSQVHFLSHLLVML